MFSTHEVLGEKFDHDATPVHALEVLSGGELGDPGFVRGLGSCDQERAGGVARAQADAAFELGDPAEIFAFRVAAASIRANMRDLTYGGD
jgi:hypothetical protein